MFKPLVMMGLMLGVAQAGVLEAWRGFSAPENMAKGFEHQWALLPMAGSVEIGPKAWSGHYWPSNEGGVNVRWNHPDRVGFKYRSPTRDEVEKMTLEERAQLAPSEKYDLFVGKYQYPFKRLASKAANPRAADWAGICHGWAPATLHHNEPTPKTMVNPDGIEIPFGSSDIKALLSYYYAFHHKAPGSNQVGLRCFLSDWIGIGRNCDQDLNAGAFHIILANKLGIRKEGLMADVDRYKEVWNQPVVAYESQVLEDNLRPSKKAAKTAVKEILVATKFFYVDEVKNVTWDVVHGTSDQIIASRKYRYRLELDEGGMIVGGEWESKDRPDFLWNRPKAEEFVGILSGIEVLLND
jgi:hypothetical protein